MQKQSAKDMEINDAGYRLGELLYILQQADIRYASAILKGKKNDSRNGVKSSTLLAS
jgi:hypothetical protein